MAQTSRSAIASKRLGAKVRAARNAQGVSQAHLAKRMGKSQPYVANLEGGAYNPTLGQLMAIADGLGAELRLEFVTRERQPVGIPRARAGRAETRRDRAR